MMLANPTCRHGFTMIEMLGAVALAAMMMAAVLGVLRRMTNRVDSIMKTSTHAAWHDRLASTVWRDLTTARRYTVSPDELHLVGYGGANRSSSAPTLRPTEIVYAVVQHGHDRWLVREELHLDQASNHHRRRQLVCRGVTKLALESKAITDSGEEHAGRFPDDGRVVIHHGQTSPPTVVPFLSKIN